MKYKTYEEWEKVYLGDDDILSLSAMINNLNHLKTLLIKHNNWPSMKDFVEELKDIRKNRSKAILYLKSGYGRTQDICESLLRGDIDIL